MNRTVRFVATLLRSPLGFIGFLLIGVFVLMALAAPWLSPYDPIQIDLANRLSPPDLAHWLGTDQSGRDVLSRIIWGSRASLLVGLCAASIGLIGGVALGILAGFYSGSLLDQVAMRIVDILFSIPLLVAAIAVVGIIGVGPLKLGPFLLPNETKIILLVGFLYIPWIARVTYAAALVESKADYVLARRAQGTSDWEIMFSDVLGNCLSPVIVQATLFVAIGIIVESSMSFVGLGVQPPQPSWGTMLADARGYVLSGEWWLQVFPGLAISLTVIGFNLVGDGLRDLLDPRKKTTALMV